MTASPLVSVDKSGPRKTYKYRLISKVSLNGQYTKVEPSRYQDYKNKLKKLLATGTDAIGESFSRREQSILREWLFGNAQNAKCAICGEIFNVSALVAAHKKNRAKCTESERVDPYIVFPLCVFGCDYLYESRTLTIKAGKVAIAGKIESDARDSVRAVELCGIELNEEWLRGNSEYFEVEPSM